MAGLVRRAHPWWLDKAVHAALYAVLGWLVAAAMWVSGRRGIKELAFGLAAIFAYAALDEVHQMWLPGRVATVTDWLADAAGATIGLVAGMVLMRRTSAAAPDEDRPPGTRR
jgi:VanZ family protein